MKEAQKQIVAKDLYFTTYQNRKEAIRKATSAQTCN